MRTDSRLTRMLHVLIHMDYHSDRTTSENIAQMLNTNPVVVRRTMAGLRDHGYVQSEKGHGGGWLLTRPLDQMSILDIYLALGKPPLFAFGPADDHPNCQIEQSVNTAIDAALRDAETSLMTRFSAITLADLAHRTRCAGTGDGYLELLTTGSS
jgi:Rrf2 family protein